MTTTKKTTKKSRSTAAMLVSAIQSSFTKALEGLKLFIHLVLRLVSLDELAMLAGNTEKCQTLAEYARDLIRGVKREGAAVGFDFLEKLNVIEEVTDGPRPEGGKVFRVFTIIDWALGLAEYVLAMCPQTGRDWDIFRVLEQYVADWKGKSLGQTYLVWFGRGVYKTAPQALEWVENQKLDWEWAHFRATLAIVGNVSDIVPQLKKLGYCYDSVGLVTGRESKLGAGSCLPSAWRNHCGERQADLFPVSSGWSDRYVFAFRRK